MTESNHDPLTSALIALNEDEVAELVVKHLEDNKSPIDILESLQSGMEVIGEKYADGSYFLAELIMAAEIFTEATKKIEPRLVDESPEVKGQVVFATVKGDLHDLGKNIAIVMLRGNGFEVVR